MGNGRIPEDIGQAHPRWMSVFIREAILQTKEVRMGDE
jgi:hypothetical protein